MRLPIVIARNPAHIVGRAFGVGKFDDDEPELVNGYYELSTIDLGNRRETVAFKVSGTGPRQISEPRSVKTITITES